MVYNLYEGICRKDEAHFLLQTLDLNKSMLLRQFLRFETSDV